MVDIVIFTSQEPAECETIVRNFVVEWLETYLSVPFEVPDDLNDILALRMVGPSQNGWHCESYVLHPEFVFEKAFDDWGGFGKSQLLDVRSHIFQLLNLIEDKDKYHVFKFNDEYEQRLNSIFYDEICELEQMIRNTLTTIFYPKNPNMIYELLGLTNATPQGYSATAIREHAYGHQNEFFYLSIDQYKKLANQALVTREGIVTMAKDYGDLATFLEDIKNVGQLTQSEATVITSIGDNLTIIKDFRNCIMHSRAYSDDDVDSFQKAREKLKQIILDFQNNDGRIIQ